ncbi:endonuclease/exonuclease/phosphatase family protein [Paraglaciecola sp. 20A4]|uniref:endonuclease/exonuclease/phosphatase family protein n=1 Tax=Paraglaciecola sp. 20A4 TaxID=2687288 RepID=UPI0014088D48|nr:endonuclease/exonuclease/phosphatase family protein [Paraglaciecola sp. 20A4]
MFTTFIISTCFLLTLTLLPLVPSDHWTVRVWEFPRLQIAALLTLNLLAIGGIYHQNLSYMAGLLVVNFAALAYQIHWILPYTTIVRPMVSKNYAPDFKRSIKIINANVLMTNHDAPKLIKLVVQEKPHILVTLESNQWWQDALSPLHDAYPYRVNFPLENLYGMHVFSRLPLSDIKTAERVEKGVPSVHCVAELESGEKIQCHFVHPAPPSPTENEEATERDRELLGLAKQIALEDDDSTLPIIVSGDLNDVAWSPTTQAFLRVSGLCDPRIGRGAFNTFHAQHVLARWPLDHVFHSEHFELVNLSRLPEIGSDHFPLLTELCLK